MVVVGSSARVKGNLFSAKGQVSVKYLPDAEGFLSWWQGSIVVAAVKGGVLPGKVDVSLPTAFCFGSEVDPAPRTVRQKADAIVTIPQYGQAPCLTADQAAAIVLYCSIPEVKNHENLHD